MRTFVVGLGRAGAGLHASVLGRLRASGSAGALFADRPLVVLDPAISSSDELAQVLRRWKVPGLESPGAVLVASVDQAAGLLDPARTVVHLTTPPESRLEILGLLAAAGFRAILVEKPLALDEPTLAGIEQLRRRYRLRLVVVAQWLVSTLTARLAELVRGAELGDLRSLSFLQSKPRFSRSLAVGGPGRHPTAFDVEPPHSVGVALRLAGPARLAEAACTDMVVGGSVRPGLGGARLALRHDGGVRTVISSDLTSPVRRRRIVLRFDRGVAIGHYPGSEDDHHAQLRVLRGRGVHQGRGEPSEVFADDALTAFLLRAYQGFLGCRDPGERDFALHASCVRLLCAAKRYSAATRYSAGEDAPAWSADALTGSGGQQ